MTNKLTDNEIKQRSEFITQLAKQEQGSALKCIHQLSMMGGATKQTYQAIEERIVQDQDAYGAYHLALLAQTTADLPIDVQQLIELVIEKGDNPLRLSLLKNLPLPPVSAIRNKILASQDKKSIADMQAYLQKNPEGIGSQHQINHSQKVPIMALSQPLNVE